MLADTASLLGELLDRADDPARGFGYILTAPDKELLHRAKSEIEELQHEQA